MTRKKDHGPEGSRLLEGILAGLGITAILGGLVALVALLVGSAS